MPDDKKIAAETKRLIICRALYSDIAPIRESSDRQSLIEYIDSLPLGLRLKTRADAYFMAKLRFRCESEARAEYYAAYLKTGEIAGYVGLLPAGGGEYLLQYAVRGDLRKQGYGFEMVTAVLPLLEERPDFEFATAEILPNNLPSIRLAEKLGAQLLPPESAAESRLMRTYIFL